MDNFTHILTQPFYNSIMLNSKDWEVANDKAAGQEHLVKIVFESNPELAISPWQVRNYLQAKLNKKVNINSTRRCLSNLKNKNVLIILTSTRIGDEGVSEHFYILKSGNEGRYDIKTEKFETPTVDDYATKIMQIGKQSKLEL